MPAPKTLSKYPTYYWNIALQVSDALNRGERPAEFRFPAPGKLQGVTVATVLSQMRRLLTQSDNFEHAALGRALEGYSIGHENQHLVLRRKASDDAGRLDAQTLARIHAIRAGLGRDSTLGAAAVYTPSAGLQDALRDAIERSGGQDAFTHIGLDNLEKRKDQK